MWTRTEAAARARSDADFAFMSTAPSRRWEIMWTRTEAAALARLTQPRDISGIDGIDS